MIYSSATASMAEPKEHLVIGEDLGAYRILKVLGGGGMGIVYEAEHRRLRKRVALKALYGQGADDPECRARFVREGTAASRIRHPHVVDITDVREEEDVAFLVMEYLDGESLGTRLQRDGALNPRELADIMLPVVAALQEAHQRGVVHRDLKPDNIFLARRIGGREVPKVLDFGISKVLGDDPLDPYLTAENAFLGTPYFMSPEQARGAANVDARSDQYSFGVSLYECATGRNPFDDHTTLIGILQAIASSSYDAPRKRVASMPPDLESIILRAMEAEPEARYRSMGELGVELLPFAGPALRAEWASYFDQFGDPVSISPVITTTAKTEQVGRQLPQGLAVAVASAAVVAAILFSALSGSQQESAATNDLVTEAGPIAARNGSAIGDPTIDSSGAQPESESPASLATAASGADERQIAAPPAPSVAAAGAPHSDKAPSVLWRPQRPQPKLVLRKTAAAPRGVAGAAAPTDGTAAKPEESTPASATSPPPVVPSPAGSSVRRSTKARISAHGTDNIDPWQ